LARSCNPLRLAIVALTLAALTGCSTWPDAYEARTCRILIPALNPAGSSFDVRSTAKLPGGGGVAVRYVVHAPDAPPRRRTLTCHYSAENLAPGDRLAEVWSDGRQLGDVRLALLKRFWLRSQEAASADPAPYLLIGQIPEVSQTAALALQHFFSALPLISIYAMLAPAYALVYGLIGRINLAFGEFAALGGYGAMLAFPLIAGLGFWPAVLIASLVLAIFTAGMHGYVASRLVFMPLRRASGQQVLIATIGLAMALQEYMRLSQGSALTWVQPFFNNPVGLARSNAFIVTVTPIGVAVTVLALAVALALLGVMRWSRFGRCWRACADDPTAAAMLGVDFSGILATTFVLAAAMAGLAGAIVTFYYGGVGYSGGIVFGLKSLIAAIVGGIGSVPGAFLGGHSRRRGRGPVVGAVSDRVSRSGDLRNARYLFDLAARGPPRCSRRVFPAMNRIECHGA